MLHYKVSTRYIICRLKHCFLVCTLAVLIVLASPGNHIIAGENEAEIWQKNAVKYAKIMSGVKWTPVADGMPIKGVGKGYFEKGKEYTGVPYSSVKYEGRYIGFDIFLKTFLAAIQNPHSVVYTENLSEKVTNSGCYYGAVCSSYTSYALQCGNWYLSWQHSPDYREGVSLVEPQSAQGVQVGDIVFTPPNAGAHVEIVTEVTRNDAGKVTHVRVEDSWPETTRNIYRGAEEFNLHIAAKGKMLCRIIDYDTWRADNKAESFLFPNYKEDSATASINRVLLLDRGDWVAYKRGQVVRFNIMDRDNQGVNKLIVKRGIDIVEEIDKLKKGIIERAFSICGDYTAYCVMNDGSHSQACEFSVCDLDFSLPTGKVTLGKPWEIKFAADNMKVVFAYLYSDQNRYNAGYVFINDEDRRNGQVTIPGDLVKDSGNLQVWLYGENRYGRLKKRQDIFLGN